MANLLSAGQCISRECIQLNNDFNPSYRYARHLREQAKRVLSPRRQLQMHEFARRHRRRLQIANLHSAGQSLYHFARVYAIEQ